MSIVSDFITASSALLNDYSALRNLASYYVDSVSGSDTASGRQGTPWKTITKAMSTVSAGSIILLARGGIWRELGKPVVSSLTFDAWGSGANPVISGANLLNSGWSASGNIWSVACAVQPYHLYINNVRGNLKTSAALLTTEYDWFWASGILKIYAPSNPATRYTTPGVEAPTRYASFDTNSQNYLSFSNITFEKANQTSTDHGYGFYIHHSHDVKVINCVIQKNYDSGIRVYGNEAASLITDGCTVMNNGAEGYAEQEVHQGSIVRNCVIHDNGWRDVMSAGILGAFSGGLVTDNLVYNNGLGDHQVNQSHNIYIIDNPGTADVERNICYGARANGIQARSSVILKNNICHHNHIHGIVVGDCSTNITADVSYNLCYANKYGLSAGRYGLNGNITLRAYRNTLAFNNDITTISDSPAGFHLDTDDLTLVDFYDNIVVASPSTYAYYIDKAQSHANYHHNDVFRFDNGTFIAYKLSTDSLRTFAQWQALGLDTGSISVDPVFVDSSNGNYALKPGSPAQGMGAF